MVCPEDIIHIGGIAIFYHIQSKLLEKYTQDFANGDKSTNPVKLAKFMAKIMSRGTHDVDLLIRNPASFNQVLNKMSINQKTHLSQILSQDQNRNLGKTKIQISISKKIS